MMLALILVQIVLAPVSTQSNQGTVNTQNIPLTTQAPVNTQNIPLTTRAPVPAPDPFLRKSLPASAYFWVESSESKKQQLSIDMVTEYHGFPLPKIAKF